MALEDAAHGHGRRNFAQPQWRGEAAAGRTLLIHAEQGFGDTLQFCRYAPLAAARGLRVIMEVQKPLVRLLRGLPGVDLVVARGEELPAFDLHCPMLSLPLALGTTSRPFPRRPLSARRCGQAAAWRTRLAAMASRAAGSAWRGRAIRLPRGGVDRRRSLAPERLAPLFELPGVQFFSLQKDGPAAPAEFPLTDFMDGDGRLRRHRGLDRQPRPGHLGRYRRRPSGGGAGQAGLAAGPLRSVLALARRAARQPVVSDAAPVPPAAPGDWDPVMAEVVRDLEEQAGGGSGQIADLIGKAIAIRPSRSSHDPGLFIVPRIHCWTAPY